MSSAPEPVLPASPARAPGVGSRTWKWISVILGAAIFLAVVGTCLRLGFLAAFGNYNYWDDEGYFLSALREFRAHGGLYDRIDGVFYGPVYFQFIAWGFGLLGVPLDNAAARWFEIAAWGAALLAAGFVTWRFTRSFLAASFAVLLGFPYFVQMTNEPLHATSPILVFLALLLLVACGRSRTLEQPPRAAAMAVCGVACAAILLVKINVGLFVFLAFAAAYPPGGTGRTAVVLRWALAIALVALPVVLMRPLLEHDWAQNFALLVSVSLLPFALRLPRSTGGVDLRTQGFAFAAGAAGVIVLSIGSCFLRGTTPRGMWRSLVVDGLAFAQANSHAPALPEQWILAAAALIMVFDLVTRPGSPTRAMLRLAVGVYVVSACLRTSPSYVALPFLWILSGSKDTPASRTFPGLLTVLLALQAFPIPGCQQGLFCYFVPFVAVIGICDAWRDLDWRAERAWIQRFLLAPGALALGVFVLLRASPILSQFDVFRNQWNGLARYTIPGFDQIHGPELAVANKTWLVENLKRNCDTFVGIPGQPSLHLASGVPPPVPFYPHHWVLFYDLEKEQRLAQALLQSARPAIVRSDYLTYFWLIGKPFREGALTRALKEDFRLVGKAGTNELWLPRTATPDLVLSVRQVTLTEQQIGRFRDQPTHRLRFVETDARVTRLTLRNLEVRRDFFDTGLTNLDMRMYVLNLEGDKPVRNLSVDPIDLRHESEALVRFPTTYSKLDLGLCAVLAFDRTGNIVARLLFEP